MTNEIWPFFVTVFFVPPLVWSARTHDVANLTISCDLPSSHKPLLTSPGQVVNVVETHGIAHMGTTVYSMHTVVLSVVRCGFEPCPPSVRAIANECWCLPNGFGRNGAGPLWTSGAVTTIQKKRKSTTITSVLYVFLLEEIVTQVFHVLQNCGSLRHI